ncbi:MAG: hypothetical protein Q4B54_11425 [Coriobacteriales bacterium]|nr:hypothetical protein [Coriobacteriales bacterium]
MGLNGMEEYWAPEHVREYLRSLGFVLPLDDMEPWIRAWDDWMGARGDFYDYRDKDGLGRVYEVHRRSIHPAMRVCKEWGSLLLNEEVKVVCDDQKATDLIGEFFSSTNFMAQAQATVVRAFGLGTGARALWVDLDKRKVRIRHYDARMVIPLTWDEDGVTECAFVTRAFYRGKVVDLTFDALINEVDVSKMRVFLSDVLFDREKTGDKSISIPFGKQDCTVFRKVMSTEDMVQEFAPPLRTSSQSEAFRIALQILGDPTGFGITYFDFDNTGYVKTATEVSSDNSSLMRNIRRHENALEGAITGIVRAVMAVSRGFGEGVPDEGSMRVQHDDSIVQDVAAEKEQDMREVGVTMAVWEYRAKWYGEDEKTAKARANELAGEQSAKCLSQ